MVMSKYSAQLLDVRVLDVEGHPVWDPDPLTDSIPHALWREESVSNGACSEF